ncbi:hypothetical protein K492DRAFT_172555 [Lichtheimia hyalospora FSU 10163]|nr:hypothetical protein K492DRAFT_172555 [Lichtheimia hyalospora FSU 10163]
MDFSTTRKQFGYIKILDHRTAVIQPSATGVIIGAIAIFLVGIAFKYRTDALDLSRHVNIFMCTLWSRPGLFVPTLFVIHDVSLTPTRKVA